MPTTEEIKQWITDAIKWHRHDGVLTQRVLLNQLFGFRRRWNDILNLNTLTSTMNAVTNGTTPVTSFIDTSDGATPFAFLVVIVGVISLDTTAGTITLKKTSAGVTTTIATIAKGTTAGVITYATSVANNSLVPGDILSAVSSSAGNAIVKVEVLFPNN